MPTIALIGLLGGLITGISPCILPVLPVVFLSGLSSGRVSTSAARPYLVIAGLVCSFSVVTLAGSALLSALHLPQDAIRWAALVTLTLIGLGLVFPPLMHLLERPFTRIPQLTVSGRSGFGLGLTLGALYVPCAGPVLAAIVVAGGTRSVGLPTLVLTATFAVGTALPLLVFALAGRGVESLLAQRVSAFRRRQRAIQIVGGITMIVLAVALVFNLPAILQRAVPDYTVALQKAVQRSVGGGDIQRRLNPGGDNSTVKGQLADCAEVSGGPGFSAQLQQCGPAPAVSGITQWLNTPDRKSIDVGSLRGKVVLIDFWAYSCINCQRAISHVVDWYNRYRDDGFVVIGVHTPEYTFERVPGNVASGAAALHISYPVALDNDYQTWNNYQNLYWPADYLIDATGTVRHTKFGEGDYSITEKLIRQLLVEANPGVRLPAPGDAVDTTPQTRLTPETYLGVHRAGNYGGDGEYKSGSFGYPATLAADKFALRGRWILDDQGATAEGDIDGSDAAIRLNYTGKAVYAVVGGTGTLTVNRDGKTTTTSIGGPPTLHQIVGTDPGDSARHDQLDMQVSKGLQVFSFTFG